MAGDMAEREWRVKEGMVGVAGLDEAAGRLDGKTKKFARFWNGEWTVQGVVNWVVGRLVVVES